MEKIYLQNSALFTYRSAASGRYGLSSDKRGIADGLATGAIFNTRQEAIECGLIRIQRLLASALARAVTAEESGTMEESD